MNTGLNGGHLGFLCTGPEGEFLVKEDELGVFSSLNATNYPGPYQGGAPGALAPGATVRGRKNGGLHRERPEKKIPH